MAFSFPVMLSSMLVALAVLIARSRFNDPDMWWHLRTGQVIWSKHVIPTTDLFSYTAYHRAWVPQEWLSQVLIYSCYHFAGYTGLMLWLCLATAVLYISGYVLCSLYSGNAKVSLLGALLIWFFSSIGIAIRPQMIGYLLLVLELLLLHLGRTRSPRWFLLLPPLFAVWVNSHASFILGVIVAVVIFGCSFLDFRVGPLAGLQWDRRHRRFLALALTFSAAALFLNPTGVKQILFPFDLMWKQPINIGHVQEWLPLPINSARAIGLIMVLGSIALLVIRRSTLYLDELALLAIGAGLAVQHARMLFVFGILAAPLLSRLLAGSWDSYDPSYDRPGINALLIAATLLAAVLGFPSSRTLNAQVKAGSPVKAVEYMQTHHLSGNMLNEYVYGGYLIWAAQEHPVFVDGRAELYEPIGVLGELFNWVSLQSDPASLLKKYDIHFCLLAHNSPMTHVLPLLPGWKMVFSGTNAVIFVRNPQPDS